MRKLLYCLSCKIYTLKSECAKCGQVTVTPKPQKFSIEDNYGQYRRQAKRKQLQEEGSL